MDRVKDGTWILWNWIGHQSQKTIEHQLLIEQGLSVMSKSVSLILCFIVFVAILNHSVVAQETQSELPTNMNDSQATEAKKLFDFFSLLSTRFDAKLATGQPVQSNGKSLLNWTITNSWHGSFFVWTSEGKPVLVGCILSDSEDPNFRRSFIELHSMTQAAFTPLAFNGIKKYRWNPDSKRNVPIPIESGNDSSVASITATTKASTRRVMLRKIAESFEVTMFQEASKGNSLEKLRMLTTPLYRYPAIGNDGADGAIFAFVTSKGTDPEFLLAVECVVTDGRMIWQIRPMRFCTRSLELKRANNLMWRVDEYDESRKQTSLTDPYMIITLMETNTNQFNAMREKIRDTDHRLDQP